MLAALQQDLDEVRDTRKKTYETLDPKFDQSDELARSYGLTACATF